MRAAAPLNACWAPYHIFVLERAKNGVPQPLVWQGAEPPHNLCMLLLVRYFVAPACAHRLACIALQCCARPTSHNSRGDGNNAACTRHFKGVTVYSLTGPPVYGTAPHLFYMAYDHTIHPAVHRSILHCTALHLLSHAWLKMALHTAQRHWCAAAGHWRQRCVAATCSPARPVRRSDPHQGARSRRLD